MFNVELLIIYIVEYSIILPVNYSWLIDKYHPLSTNQTKLFNSIQIWNIQVHLKVWDLLLSSCTKRNYLWALLTVIIVEIVNYNKITQ